MMARPEIFVNDNSTGPCAYNLCPYDEAMVSATERKIYEKYSIDKSKKGYAAPSMQGVFYIVEITYCNKFNGRHSVIYKYKYEHVHGHGYDKTTISPEELDELLQQSAMPALQTKKNCGNISSKITSEVFSFRLFSNDQQFIHR
jgi:hypothetical protein